MQALVNLNGFIRKKQIERYETSYMQAKSIGHTVLPLPAACEAHRAARHLTLRSSAIPHAPRSSSAGPSRTAFSPSPPPAAAVAPQPQHAAPAPAFCHPRVCTPPCPRCLPCAALARSSARTTCLPPAPALLPCVRTRPRGLPCSRETEPPRRRHRPKTTQEKTIELADLVCQVWGEEIRMKGMFVYSHGFFNFFNYFI